MKHAEDSNAVVVRLYEAGGGRRATAFRTALVLKQAWRSNILEEELEPLLFTRDAMDLVLDPFQLLTLKLEW